MSKYIDADKAIEVCDWYEHEYIECEDYIRTIADDIRHLPAADVVEVMHGRWVEMKCRSVDNVAYTAERCSVCNAMYPRMHANYCPNCGSRMDLDEVTE